MRSNLYKYLDNILDVLEDGIAIVNRDGICLRMNKSCEKFMDVEAELCIGRHIREIRYSDNRMLALEVIDSKEVKSTVQTYPDKRKMFLTTYPVFDDKGDVAYAVTIARDTITIGRLKQKLEVQAKLLENYQDAIKSKNRKKRPSSVFHSSEMIAILERIQHLATTDTTVLILGETGTGKDILSKYIHQASHRKNYPFIKVDCGSIAESLIESELFGYASGAFSGAQAKGKMGYFEAARGGTLFLDEIGELAMPMQTKLLRVLQDREIIRVGSTKTQKIDVRIIAATNKDLENEVKDGLFRSDLFYRLYVAVVKIPPLRERKDDILAMADNFLNYYAGEANSQIIFSKKCIEAIMSYEWPGNVRELENLIQSMVVNCRTSTLEFEDLPNRIVRQVPKQKETTSALAMPDIQSRNFKDIMDEQEKKILIHALEQHGSAIGVSKIMGLSRATLFRKMKKHGLESPYGLGNLQNKVLKNQ